MENKFKPVVEWRDPQSLIPYINNSKTHPPEQIAKIAASIAEFGFDQPIVVDEHGMIIKGHGRREGSLRLGLKAVPVVVRTDLTPAQIKAARLADNKTAESPWDEELLGLELAALREQDYDLSITGFSDDELEALLRDPEETHGGLTDEDAVPEEQGTIITQPGDVWLLGEHRLLCGDATQMSDVEKVLAGGLADMTFCDPPYGVNYGQTMKDKLRGNKRRIANDNLGDDFGPFLRDACTNILAVTKGATYICMSSSACIRCTWRSRKRAATGPRS